MQPHDTHTPEAPTRLPSIVRSAIDSSGLLQQIEAKTSAFLPLIAILALGVGVVVGTASDGLSTFVTSAASTLIDAYSLLAPALIFMVLAPVLSRIFSTRRRGRFGLYVVAWLAATKVLAMLFVIFFTVAVFGLPVLPEHSVSIGATLRDTSGTLIVTLATSHFFWAIYAAVAAGLIAVRVRSIAATLERGVTSIEYAGQYLQPAIPLFMFAVGVYVQALPDEIDEQIGLGGVDAGFHTVSILGLHMDPNTTAGMLAVYVVGALLVAVASFAWHFAILGLAKYQDNRFSLRDYFTNYWIKAYPLLWSTSSESLATPLNLYILSRRAPWVRPTVRRVVIGAGSVLCTNGTLISVFILLGIVGGVLGLRFSLIELLLCIPVAFLISFGIPGIPGELILFAGPLAAVLNIPPELMPLFLALYLGLQLGLPDSFRTGANTTNNYVYAILLNKTYEERFLAEEAAA